LPTSELVLTFRPPYPKWFVCGSMMAMKNNIFTRDKARQVTATKFDIYTIQGDLTFSTRIFSEIGTGEA